MAAIQAPGSTLSSVPSEPSPVARGELLRRSLACTLLIAGIGLSLSTLYSMLGVVSEQRLTFLTQNFLAEPAASKSGITALALLPALVAAVAILWKRARALVVVESVAKIASPLLLAFALPGLFVWQLAQQRPVAYLVLLAGWGLALERLLRVSFRELSLVARGSLPSPSWVLGRPGVARMSNVLAASVVVLAAAAYAAYMSFYTIRHHHLIATTAFDLGIYDNMIFNAMKGHFFQAPVLYGPGKFNSLSGHAEYVVPLFALFYAIKPGAETLLVMQAIAFGGAAIPLYMFARTMLGRLTSTLLALSYLLFAPLHGPQFYDFHWLPMCIPMYFFLFYAIATRKNWLVYLMVVLLFALREDLAIGLACLGAFLFLSGARVRFGLGLAFVSTVWFSINKFVIMPWAGSWWFENLYSELFADGKASYGNVIKTLISNPFFALSTLVRGAKFNYLLHMLAPLVFLPVRRLGFLLLFLPGAFLTLLTTGYAPTISIAFQYTSHWIPFLFGACALTLYFLRRGEQGQVRVAAAIAALSVTMLSHSYNFGALLQHESFVGGFGRVQFEMTETARKRYEDLRRVVSHIPADASVACTEYMSPHVSTRLQSYVFRYDVGPVDYILLSDNEMSFDLRRSLADKFRKYGYGLVAKGQKEFYLYKRGFVSPETAAANQHLGIRVDP
ncbi:MAG TPA: DUF2079 domain-containing protein [Polyangiaceae bacterium]|nr:DUF2079 domain-containing protein [Polyangiaceae bacterium]